MSRHFGHSHQDVGAQGLRDCAQESLSQEKRNGRRKRQEARGKSKEVFSDFTFLYTVWFYCVHLVVRQIYFDG
ncbi:hypothetical protein FJR39_13520 [Dolichospermum flos-aquae UHCC 0037]|uniref:Uncharacterized protein n=1 Tax=Dolichospermum flos-aquae UHCC 0037 TaxID=2590026 RepID=A0ACC7S6K4_DOLFA|nr:hypothetical protein [Aphanizomenon sp. UHCC 0183]MTJ44143.1 hypothetical protein [Dolichospermum flos-aquae UHCC 0037]